ncbi:hypothetical protein QU830_27090, partial [Escherichia coli]|nr:hypothetical protein [Escherichia coli]MDM9201154.1 hypothetical protein [Escherichia coli]
PAASAPDFRQHPHTPLPHSPASGGTAIQAAAAKFHFATGGFTGTGGKYEPAGIVHRGEFVFTKEATSRIGVGNLYRLMRGYAEGGYVGAAGSPAQMRRA